MRFVKWSTGIIASIVGTMFALTKSCNLITSDNSIHVVLGFGLLAITVGITIWAGHWLFITLEEMGKKYFR